MLDGTNADDAEGHFMVRGFGGPSYHKTVPDLLGAMASRAGSTLTVQYRRGLCGAPTLLNVSVSGDGVLTDTFTGDAIKAANIMALVSKAHAT